jgi:hypothetical protein
MNREYGDFVISKGTYLKDKMGVNEWAFKRMDALDLVEIMKKFNMAILGGDVIRESNGKFEYAKDNWSNNRNIDESTDEFIKRSLQLSENYIKNYSEKQGWLYYYVIV